MGVTAVKDERESLPTTTNAVTGKRGNGTVPIHHDDTITVTFSVICSLRLGKNSKWVKKDVLISNFQVILEDV